jgi:hypothetical protein
VVLGEAWGLLTLALARFNCGYEQPLYKEMTPDAARASGAN